MSGRARDPLLKFIKIAGKIVIGAQCEKLCVQLKEIVVKVCVSILARLWAVGWFCFKFRNFLSWNTYCGQNYELRASDFVTCIFQPHALKNQLVPMCKCTSQEILNSVTPVNLSLTNAFYKLSLQLPSTPVICFPAPQYEGILYDWWTEKQNAGT